MDKIPKNMSVGEAVMVSIVSSVQALWSTWELKIICALHMLKQYRAIIILNPRFGPVSLDDPDTLEYSITHHFIFLGWQC